MFFRLNGGAVSHVGIYVGNGRFVHAPQSGDRVREAGLDDEYFRNRYAGAGRLWQSGSSAAGSAPSVLGNRSSNFSGQK